ncbi:MAG: hypothetical protein VKJ06_01635 [Vampirovibrionales bacterium]|nr:hypothetical protein [Vampirovibrionales bacterium]
MDVINTLENSIQAGMQVGIPAMAGSVLVFLINIGLFATKAELQALRADLIQQSISRDEVERALAKIERTIQDALAMLRQDVRDDFQELKSDVQALRGALTGITPLKKRNSGSGGRADG